MVQKNEEEPEFQPRIKPENDTLLKKFDIPIEHLDFKYLENCNNAKEIDQIVQILRSGQEGFYPDLLKFAEKRLFEVNPRSRLLQTTVPILSKFDIPKDEWQELSSDLQNWIEDVNKNDKELTSFQDIKSSINNVPVRECRTQQNKKIEKKERIKSMDYEAWDKLDVDTEILKMDIKDEKIKKEALKKAEEKEKLNTIVLDPDIMTKAELKHAALQVKNAGNECYKSGDYEEALQYYTNSLNFSPTAIVYNNRAITHIKLKNYKQAIQDCNEVLKLEKENEKAYLRKSTAYKCLKQYDEAIQTIETLLQINPNSIDAQNLIQDVKKVSGKNEKIRSVRMKIEEHNESKNIEKSKEIIEEPITNKTKKENKKTVKFKEVSQSECISKKSTYKDDKKSSGENLDCKNKENCHKTVEMKKVIVEKSAEKSILKKNIEDKNIKPKEEKSVDKSVLKKNTEDKNVKIKEDKSAEKYILKKNTEDENVKTKKLEIESRENILFSVPSTSKFSGPFYKIVNVPSDIAKKISNTKKTPSKSDENVIDLNNPENYIHKKKVNKLELNIDRKSTDNKVNENNIDNGKIISPISSEKKNRNKNFTPFEFLRVWQSIKNDPTFKEHEELLRDLNPFNLLAVLGNKLDGEMFSVLLQCLETRFTSEEDASFIGNILTEIQKIPRIDILMLLMNSNDKHNIRNLIARTRNYGYLFQTNILEKYNRL